MRLRLSVLTLLILAVSAFTAYGKETKDVYFKFKNADPVVFSHDVHLKHYTNCKICHLAIFNLKARRHYTMAEMEKTKSCGACHNNVKAFSVASEKYCSRCHKGRPRTVVFKVKGATDAFFSHDLHLASVGGKCKTCHDGKLITGKDKGVTMAQMEKGKTCGACHNGKRAFTVAGNCGKCHKGMEPKELTFKVKDAGDVKFSHQFHLNMFKCADCHTKTFPFKAGVKKNTMGDMEKGKSCGACHNGKEAFSVAGDCEKCHKM